MAACKGSNSVPSLSAYAAAILRSSRSGDSTLLTLECSVCHQDVTAGPNAAGVLRLDDHDAPAGAR